MQQIYCPITESIATDREILAQLNPLIEHLIGNVEIETHSMLASPLQHQNLTVMSL